MYDWKTVYKQSFQGFFCVGVFWVFWGILGTCKVFSLANLMSVTLFAGQFQYHSTLKKTHKLIVWTWKELVWCSG